MRMRTVFVLLMMMCLIVVGCSQPTSNKVRIIEPSYSFVDHPTEPVAAVSDAKLARNLLDNQTIEP
ncbi:MAG: hypothetical protein ACF8OB_01985 [Phycisphaeraceae bacterium JB051]